MTKVEQALNAYYHHKHLSEHHWREYQRLNAIAHGWMERVAVLKELEKKNEANHNNESHNVISGSEPELIQQPSTACKVQGGSNDV
jgi:hypothetical protein